ncbi:MAG: hypothetical protein FWE45_04105 [Firmicutes bacterium]|nr:hypothetical protein [Bacillota bacterium]
MKKLSKCVATAALMGTLLLSSGCVSEQSAGVQNVDSCTYTVEQSSDQTGSGDVGRRRVRGTGLALFMLLLAGASEREK